jgi:Leucine-rich repeat (LRR) protein
MAQMPSNEPTPERALQLIAENKRTRANFLYLGRCGLTKVPDEVAELTWLESLSLADDFSEPEGQQWRYKPSRGSLSTNAGLNDVRALAGLRRLQTLDLSFTQVRDVKPLARLAGLQVLHLRSTEVSDVGPLAALTGLQTLDLRYTPLSDVGPLAGLTGLQALYLMGTRVSDLGPLAGLIARGSRAVWSSRSWVEGDAIYLQDCPLTNPPPEIVKQGNEAILNYFAERDSGGIDHLYEAKMLILGEGGAGKTSLLRRLYYPELPLPEEKDTTKGIAIDRHDFKLRNGKTFRLNIWDFAGQEIYHATHQFFLTHRSLYVLVDDTKKDYKSVSDEGFKYWLELIDVFSGHSPTIIFQNEKGGRSKQIDVAGIKGRFDNVKERFAGNLEDTHAADKIREAIEHYASTLPHIGDEVPARWIKVREDIETLAAKKAYAPVEEYFEIFRRYIEFDERKALQLGRYLHELGVFLHFQDDPLLARTVILQNEWATEAVFRILDDETVKGKLGRFTRADCARVWRDSKYAHMHPELLTLMQNFQLCYELRDLRPETWLAPQLLPAAKPATLAGWSKPGDLVVRYRYDFLPKGMISRITVRLHRLVLNPEIAWVNGVLFQRGDTSLLMEVLANGNEIELRARGPERKELLSSVADDLDALNDSFAGLKGASPRFSGEAGEVLFTFPLPNLQEKVDKRIPCNCSKCLISAEPEFFGQKRLLQRKMDNKLKVECPRSYEDVDVLELLDGIRFDKPSGWNDEAPPPATKFSTPAVPQVIRIFLASSSELRSDRDAFDLYFRQRNDRLLRKGVYLEIVRWENFLDAMSDSRLQDEYNKAIRQCDLFVSLFFTKTGKYTEEELEVAHKAFKTKGKPLIWTYFKNADIKMAAARKADLNSLWAFQEKLSNLGHFHTSYDEIEHLKRQFGDQLDKLLDEGRLPASPPDSKTRPAGTL